MNGLGVTSLPAICRNAQDVPGRGVGNQQSVKIVKGALQRLLYASEAAFRNRT